MPKTVNTYTCDGGAARALYNSWSPLLLQYFNFTKKPILLAHCGGSSLAAVIWLLLDGLAYT
jgi:hypothetical protein